jgi:hypothetical protein
LFCLSYFYLPSLKHGDLSHIPAGVFSILKKYRKDFLYGNISADIIFGKRFQRLKKNSHSWEIAWRLFETAETDRQRAFAYGYLTHLCADTVAHNLRYPVLPFNHPILEIRSDSLVDKRYRKILKTLDKPMQRRHDRFLEKTLESVFFSFKTNRRIFKSFLVLSKLPNYNAVSSFIDRRFPYEIPVQDIYEFQEESLQRMFELLINGRESKVQQKSPLMRKRKRLP